MLIQQHSVEEVLKLCEKGSVVVTVSRQSLASLGCMFNASMEQVFLTLQRVLPTIGFHAVLETSLAQKVSLLAAYSEFKSKYDADAKPKSPLLCSECPGWVCYAEKVVGELAIPQMSVVKSPQQVQGIMLKKQDPSLLHVTVMPCYDKKLEAVRPSEPKEVDSVLATHEIVDLLELKGIDF